MPGSGASAAKIPRHTCRQQVRLNALSRRAGSVRGGSRCRTHVSGEMLDAFFSTSWFGLCTADVGWVGFLLGWVGEELV